MYVQDRTEKHHDDHLHSTDVGMSAVEILEQLPGRWNMGTTYAEMRAYLGLETTWAWCARIGLRAEPCLFGLYSMLALLYWQLSEEEQSSTGVDWEGKERVTFSDALMVVRHWLWRKWVFEQRGQKQAFAKLPEDLKVVLLYAMAPAAQSIKMTKRVLISLQKSSSEADAESRG